MEKKKIGNLFNDAGKIAKGIADKAKERTIITVDQNDDGKFDMEDLSIIASSVANTMKIGASSVADTMKTGAASVIKHAEERQRINELNTLRPIFPNTLDQTEFLMSKFICVTDRDKKYAESDTCQGSIGFLSDKGGLRIVNLFKDSLSIFGLTFYPDDDCDFYYVNPADRDNYISLNDYFSYLKIVRINELQRVAQALGAKHFKVTYIEEKQYFSEVKVNAHMKASHAGGADVSHDTSSNTHALMDVAAEMYMDGHAPQKPDLVYLSNDDNVQNLIYLRMTEGESFHHQKISIKMSNSSGMKESDAIKIDAAIKTMKASAYANIAIEARNESSRYLEYEIDF